MQVTLAQDKCVASGQCVLAAQDVFDQRNQDGVAALLGDRPSAEPHDDIRPAAAARPAPASTPAGS